MALGQTFDLGRIYGAAESIKGARMDNQIRQQGLDTQRIMRESAMSAVDQQTGQYSPTAHAQALTKAGYPEVAQQLLGQQIEMGAKLDNYLAITLPRLNASNYGTVVSQLEGLGLPKGTLPPQFDQQAIVALAQRMKSMTQDAMSAYERIATGPGGSEVWGQRNLTTGEVTRADVIRPPKPDKERTIAVEQGDGTIRYVPENQARGMTGRQNPTRPDGGGGSAPGGLKSSDSNTIHRQVVTAFGGLYDPMGNISGLDPQQAQRVQATAAEASRIYQQEGGRIDHATAVERALQKLGQRAPAAPPPAAERPPLSSFRGR